MPNRAARKPNAINRWAVVGASFVVLYFAFGCAYSFGAFFDAFEKTFGASRASVSMVFSISTLIYFLVGAGSGALADRIGARWIVTSGIVIVGLGLIAASYAQSFWQIYLAYGLGIGIGVGFAYVPSVGAVQKHFDRRRGLASGIAVAGIGAGTLCMPILAAWLISGWDWRTAYLVLGWATILCGTIAGLLIASPGRRPGNVAAPAQSAGGGISLSAAIRTRPFVLIYLAFTFIALGNFIPLVHLVPYAMDQGASRETAVILLSLIGVGSTVGRFALGGAADRFGARKALACTFLGLAVAALWWLVSDTIWQLAIFALVMGTCYGGFVALGPVVMADYFGTRSVSAIIGTLYTGVGLGTMVGPPLAGLSFDLWQSYSLPIAACAVTATIAGVLVIMAEEPSAWHVRLNDPGKLAGEATP